MLICVELKPWLPATRLMTRKLVMRSVVTSLVLQGVSPVLTRESVFAIAMYGGSSPFDLKPLEGITNPVLRAADITDVRAIMVADPFMIKEGERWHMFFEVLNQDLYQGQIGHASSADGITWTYERIVLTEPFHISYPYVFKLNGQHYMIPESSADRTVRLYRADEFPHRWTYECTLLSGADYCDASVFEHDGHWWMFVSTNTAGNDTLHLFMSSDLHGPWIEHPESPVIRRNPQIARPAGRILAYDGRMYRFAQDCEAEYGRMVRAVEILELTPKTYREQLACEPPILEPAPSGWNNRGMHHIDAHQVAEGQWLACVDGYKRAFILNAS